MISYCGFTERERERERGEGERRGVERKERRLTS
jgi:hypothetical protein